MSCPFPSSAEWEKRVTAGAYHSKLISVQVPILVDVTEVPDLQGKRAARLSGGQYRGLLLGGRACVAARMLTRTQILTAHQG